MRYRLRTLLILLAVVSPILACLWLFASEILDFFAPFLVMLILVGGPEALFVVPVIVLIFYLIRNVGSNHDNQR